MGAHDPLPSIRDKLPKVLAAKPDMGLIHRHMLMYSIKGPTILRLCKLELAKRKRGLQSVKEKEDEISEEEDCEMMEHSQMG
jgi:hypothetical protein